MSVVEACPEGGATAHPISLGEAIARRRGMFRREARDTLADLPKEGLFDFLTQFCPLVSEWSGLDGRNSRLLDAPGTRDPDAASRPIVQRLWPELRKGRTS